MPLRNLVTILLSTFFAMGVLYSPQPLLPFFARIFSVSEAESASIISWSLLSMSIGPLFMGYFLQRYSARRMFLWCVGGLAGSTLVFAMAPDLDSMKVIRFVQGGVISAQLAATMTYIAGSATNMRQVMGYYVGSAVMGGLTGRLVAGFVSEYSDWRYFFVLTSLALFYCLWRSFRLTEATTSPGATTLLKRNPVLSGQYLRVMGDGYIRRLFAIMLLAFFSMTAILNFVPFRLEELDATMGESVISLFYMGYVAGFFISINAPRIADLMGGIYQAAGLGAGVVFLGLLVGYIPSVIAIFIAVTMVTSGFFLQHTSVATLLNVYAGDQAGVVNSLYVSIYYMGGSIGSFLPGLLYIAAGWMSFITLLVCIVLTGISIIFITRIPTSSPLTPNP